MAVASFLSDFTSGPFSSDGRTHTVYRIGTGPAVIVLAEAPGITPKVAAFARRVRDLGCTAVLPHLFGPVGGIPMAEPATAADLRRFRLEVLRMAASACISREFVLFATGRTSPVVTWLRALAGSEHERCGGPGVGAVGMCFTGGFALAMATDDRLLAPVLSQPSLPIGFSAQHRRSIGLSPEEMDVVRSRCQGGLEVIGLRFKGDKLCPPERFEYLRDMLGEAFLAVELNDDTANPDAPMAAPHSVLTEHLIDREGEPTRAALDLVLDHLRRTLLVAGN